METYIEGQPVYVPEFFLPLFYLLMKKAYFNQVDLSYQEYKAWIDSYQGY